MYLPTPPTLPSTHPCLPKEPVGPVVYPTALTQMRPILTSRQTVGRQDPVLVTIHSPSKALVSLACGTAFAALILRPTLSGDTNE